MPYNVEPGRIDEVTEVATLKSNALDCVGYTLRCELYIYYEVDCGDVMPWTRATSL